MGGGIKKPRLYADYCVLAIYLNSKMCKKPTLPLGSGALSNLPVFKPFSAFEAKHYIKKMARRIKETLDLINFDEFLSEENMNPEMATTPSAQPLNSSE